MLSFMGQGQLGKLSKLATFACQKRISENPKCMGTRLEAMNKVFTVLSNSNPKRPFVKMLLFEKDPLVPVMISVEYIYSH